MHVAIYARVSTTRQADNDLSIPDQIRQLQEWCKANDHLAVREYVELGVSATSDKRPKFQEMIADGLSKPPCFEAIIVHSHSRFFRDHIEAGVYERKLRKNGVKVISITQQTSDDPMGEMTRSIVRIVDEMQSRETSKHVMRSMCENARQGFYNGSSAPFGFKTIVTDINGSRGRKKKRLAIDEAEALIVRNIYDLYLHGHDGRTLGCKDIGKYLSERGQLMRGKVWRMQKIHTILSDRAYIGEHLFNVKDSKTGKKRPPSEWITVNSDPIIDLTTFEQVRLKRQSRSPSETPPRRVTSPNLLTGILKCSCGAGMTAMYGKSGQFKYYRCTNRNNKGNHTCDSRNISMDKLDALVLEQLAEKVFSTERLMAIMAALRKRIRTSKETEQTRINAINKQIKLVEDRQARLFDAVESGNLPNDENLQKRAHQLKAARDALLLDLVSVQKEKALPVDRILPSNLESFAKAIKVKLRDKESGFAKGYLQALVDEIVVTGNIATVKGSYAKLTTAIHKEKEGHLNQVPSFISDWCARQELNPRPLGS